MPNKTWDVITYTFRNFNDTAFEVWEWISNFTPYIIMDVITYLFEYGSQSILVNGASGGTYLQQQAWWSLV